jgi:hypothetical protein
MTKIPLTSLLLTGALASLAVAPAAAQGATAKFTVSYDATLKTTWDTPRHQWGSASCFSVPWRKASGSEEWSVRTRGKGQKLLVRTTPGGGAPVFKTGSHSMIGPEGEIRAGGLINRASLLQTGEDPGKCGGETKVHPPKPTDCGTKLPSYKLRFLWSMRPGGGLVVIPNQADDSRDEAHYYKNCTLIMADELDPHIWPDEPAKITLKRLFGSERKLDLKVSQTWRLVLSPGREGETTTTSTLTVKLKLRRVR